MRRFAPLPRAFYERDTRDVARDLLGTLLIRRERGGQLLAGRVVETEAYHGIDDAASHAHGGPTPRSAIMYGPPGMAYVYQIYGVWFCLNTVTGAEGFPSAVLIRGLGATAAEGVSFPSDDERAGAGPGKLCALLEIDKRLNGADLVRPGDLWLCDDGNALPDELVETGPRIGVAYSGEWARKPWRYWWKGHRAVSRLPPQKRSR